MPWLILLFASAGVFHHSGIKIPFFAFFAHDSGIRVKEAPANMLAAMAIAAFLCIGIGVYPAPLYALLPFEVDYHPYTAEHVVTQLQLLMFSALAFTWLMRTGLYPPELRSVNLDSDWLYRRALPRLIDAGAAVFKPFETRLRQIGLRVVYGFILRAEKHHGPNGILGRTWSTGGTVLWVAVLLGFYLILYYI